GPAPGAGQARRRGAAAAAGRGAAAGQGRSQAGATRVKRFSSSCRPGNPHSELSGNSRGQSGRDPGSTPQCGSGRDDDEKLKRVFHLPTRAELKRAALISAVVTLASLIVPATALAQAVNIDFGSGAGLTDRVVQLIGLITVLSLAPSIVIMTTSF